MSDNGSEIVGLPQRTSTMCSDLSAFDRLPLELRRILNDAPVKMSAEDILFYVERGHATSAIANALHAQFKSFLATPREQTGWPG